MIKKNFWEEQFISKSVFFQMPYNFIILHLSCRPLGLPGYQQKDFKLKIPVAY